MENLLQFRPGVLLGEDESNQVHRVRTTITVNAWFASMSAVERGAVVAAAYAAAHAAPQEPEQAQSADAPAEAPPRPSEGLDGEVLRVVVSNPEKLTPAQAEVVRRVQDGGYVVRDGVAGQWFTVGADGHREKIRSPMTVQSLIKAQVLQ
jgi:hypothetical protein